MLTPDECAQVANELLVGAREVASAAGGMLGVFKVGAEEKACLAAIANELGLPR